MANENGRHGAAEDDPLRKALERTLSGSATERVARRLGWDSLADEGGRFVEPVEEPSPRRDFARDLEHRLNLPWSVNDLAGKFNENGDN